MKGNVLLAGEVIERRTYGRLTASALAGRLYKTQDAAATSAVL